ncbi:hypothetical protein CGLO_04779 [Colletotrichum gloeosporioides Cg-14]|uniref:Uncharacterized protein n=1 Tax=Colletotrichum gloeosporioides (strain Cg-14) TaxID=1237896 RepID=T0KRK8_COLGC|nr:hypothetical protein CGLO_04779 [Colletotrichum gloeosporioides Cg-14]
MSVARTSTFIAALAAAISVCHCFGVTVSDDALILANAIFTGPGVVVQSATFTGFPTSSGTFTDGLGGIGNGAILTNGAADGALPGGNQYNDNGLPGSSTYCGSSNTFDASILSVSVTISSGYNGVQVQFIMASQEEGSNPDPIGIFLGGQQYAIDTDGSAITAISGYLADPIGITPPDSVTSYAESSPPLLVGIPATGTQDVVFAICDFGDVSFDSALMIKAGGCVDCDPQVKIDYVTTTATVLAGQEFTSTVKADPIFNDRIFNHKLANIIDNSTIKHARVVNHFHRQRHDNSNHPIIIHNYRLTAVYIRYFNLVCIAEHFCVCFRGIDAVHSNNDIVYAALIAKRYRGIVEHVFNDTSPIVDAQNSQHQYGHVFSLYKFILKRVFGPQDTRTDAVATSSHQFCWHCPFHAYLDVDSRYKRRSWSVLKRWASNLRQCPCVTN